MLNALLRRFGYTKATDPRAWTHAAMRMGGGGSRGEPPPFNYDAAVKHYASWVFAAASINGNAVASTPLRLFVRAGAQGRHKAFATRRVSRERKAYLLGDGRQTPSVAVMRKAAEIGTDFEEVTDTHPVLSLLARSNPFINGFDACVLRVIWQELCGNAYLHIVTNPRLGVPAQLWPMPPQWVRIVPDEDQFVSGYLYGRNAAQEVKFETKEVIHFKRPNPRDLWYGMGKLEAAWGAASANVAVHAMDLSTFQNNARPDYLLSVKGQAGEAELDALEERIRTKFKGPSRGGHFLVSSSDIDLKPLSFPPKDIVGRDDIVEEIAACFGVPVTMLKANDPNLASARQGFQSWREMTILPLCRMDEEVLNQRLLPLFDLGTDDAVLAYDNPVAADEQMELTRRSSAVAGGWMTPNEARAEQGLERVDDPHADMLHVGGMPLGGPQAGGGMPMGGLGMPAGDAAPAEALPALPEPAEAASPALAGSDGTEGEDGAPADQPVANTALNGAQISSLVNLASAAKSGELPTDSAKAIAEAAFPSIPAESIAAIFDPIIAAGPAATPAESKPAEPEPVAKAEDGDCVGDKVRKLRAEGYGQEQAVAIAISMCEEGKRSRTKAVEDIGTTPPKSVQANARRALKVREGKPSSERGMTAVGIARARDLANGSKLSERTIRRMLAYFDRHQSDKQGSTWGEQGKGWQAWMGWGGDEGWSWARRKVEEFDRARKQKTIGDGDPICEECGDDLATEGLTTCSDCRPAVVTKDCGTGSGGFQPGNTCGEEDGGGSDGDKPDGDKPDGDKPDGPDTKREGTDAERQQTWNEVQESAIDPATSEEDLDDSDLMGDAIGGDLKAQMRVIAAQRVMGDSDRLAEVSSELFADASDPSDDGQIDITVLRDDGSTTDKYLTQATNDAIAGTEGRMLKSTIEWAIFNDDGSLAVEAHEGLREAGGIEVDFDPAIMAYAGDKHYRWMNDSQRDGQTPFDSVMEYVDKLPAGRRDEFVRFGKVDPERVAAAFFADFDDIYEWDEEDDEDPRQLEVKDRNGQTVPFAEALRTHRAFLDEQRDNPDRAEVIRESRRLFDEHGKQLTARLVEVASAPLTKPGEKPVQVIRGINVDDADVAKLRDAMQTGNTISMDGFTSATVDTKIAQSFATGLGGRRQIGPEALLMTIRARRGVAVNPRESEVILPPGRFEVVRRREVRNHGTLVTFVELEQLDD